MTKLEKAELYNFFENISPAELSKIRGKRQETSTRDKERLLKKVAEIDEILVKLNVKFTVK